MHVQQAHPPIKGLPRQMVKAATRMPGGQSALLLDGSGEVALPEVFNRIKSPPHDNPSGNP
jgi:hypothetical protein